jgi:hypothetical protein
VAIAVSFWVWHAQPQANPYSLAALPRTLFAVGNWFVGLAND